MQHVLMPATFFFPAAALLKKNFFLYLIFYLGIFTETQPSKVRMHNNNTT